MIMPDPVLLAPVAYGVYVIDNFFGRWNETGKAGMVWAKQSPDQPKYNQRGNSIANPDMERQQPFGPEKADDQCGNHQNEL